MLLLLLTICYADQIFIISSSLYSLANQSALAYTPPKECGTPLTNAKKISMRMHYLLGRAIADKYAHNYYLTPSNSTNSSLDITSLYSLLTGLYTPGTGYSYVSKVYPYVENLSIIDKELDECKDRVLPFYSNAFSFPTYISEGGNCSCNNSDSRIKSFIESKLSNSNICVEYIANSSRADDFIGAYHAYLSVATATDKDSQINCNPTNFRRHCKSELFDIFNETYQNITQSNLSLVHYSYPLANYTVSALSNATYSNYLYIKAAVVPQMQLITFLKYIFDYDVNITDEGIQAVYLIFHTYSKNKTVYANISINEKYITDVDGNMVWNLTKFLEENITSKYNYELYKNECNAVVHNNIDPNDSSDINVISTIIEVSLLVLIVIFCMLFQRAKSSDESNMAEEKKLDEQQLKEIEMEKESI